MALLAGSQIVAGSEPKRPKVAAATPGSPVKRSAIVTARKPKVSTFGDAPNMTQEKHERRGAVPHCGVSDVRSLHGSRAGDPGQQ